MNDFQTKRDVFTVSRLSQDAHGLLEREFGLIWVEAELSSVTRPGSGHLYFTLKDSRSQIRCAMFKARNRLIDFKPEHGQQVLVRGRLSIYQARGDFQLIAEHMELAGQGLLQQKLEQSLARLRQAGWFDDELKKPIPQYPRTIGVVTSPTGAAIKDILNILGRRYPVARVIVYPTLVQGASAATEIAATIAKADLHGKADVIIVARGGGSLEDLWGFNEENVAAAILQCQLPVISGIGHEIDVTIADLVADLRAPTPSAAAELAVPDINEEKARLNRLTNLLQQAVQYKLHPASKSVQQLANRLMNQHPQKVLSQRTQRVDELEIRLNRGQKNRLAEKMMHLGRTHQALLQHSPERQLERLYARLANLQLRLETTTITQVTKARGRLEQLSHALDTVSPLATLSRGYAVVKNDQGKVITVANSVAVGEKLENRLFKGKLISTVTAVEPE